MKTASSSTASFPTPSTPSILHQNLNINTSDQRSLNTSISYPIHALGISCFTMILGIISNLTALGILFNSRARFRRQSKATFLQLTVTLLLVDLGGHLILGTFALYQTYGNPPDQFCNIFGANMVFFGLCPLLLGFTMAVERYVAITRPFLHLSIPLLFFPHMSPQLWGISLRCHSGFVTLPTE